MGYTGKLAAQFKEAYIAEFDRMEARLRDAGAITKTVRLAAFKPVNEKKVRYFRLLLERPQNISPRAWNKMLQAELGVAESTLRYWRNEGLPGLVIEKEPSCWGVEISVGDQPLTMCSINFDRKALQWCADSILAQPEAPISTLYRKLVVMAEKRRWRIGCVRSFGSHCKRIANLIIHDEQDIPILPSIGLSNGWR
jgi:hypothetical protein